ncbi:hypothetical protein [Penaeicola halotolerans]|uniref:hypothetical protein n=1 Tax=Penaeicola halotolerans TaxID=2793196 RepID=UPI001CF87E8D|nr:hypothetical protein [Penaeicola halotolerans]
MKKFLKIAIPIGLVVLAIIIWWRYFFVFSEGVKAGDLNYFEKKGFVFKTYEGRLVQAGFQSPTPGGLQSNEFRFSVESDEIASKLERASGRFVELRYKEYFAPVPWRGASTYVVTEVLDIQDGKEANEMPVK